MKFVKYIEKTENVVIAILFTILTLAIFAQVINRNIVQKDISWFEELARYCMVFMTFLGAELGLRDGSQLSIDSVTKRLSPKTSIFLKKLSSIIIIGFSVLSFTISIKLLKMQITTGMVTPALQIPTYVPFLSITIGFFLISMTQIICFIYSFIPKNVNNEEAKAQ